MTVAVVGAGLAGLRTCEALRARGYAGSIVLVGMEKHAPYSRPPLSKEVLRGDKDVDAATLRTPDELARLELDLRLGRSAGALDVDGHRLELDDGTFVSYDACVIATGARPRRLPGVDIGGVHTLRTVDDALALRGELQPGRGVVVVGAGFIGLEVAASARARGCEVTVVDVLPAPLARALHRDVGDTVARLHADNGVAVRCGVGVDSIVGDTSVEAVALSDGTTVRADLAVVGVGVTPATEWLDGSGLTLDDGVVCDPGLRAGQGVWAVGDVARWQPPSLATYVRIEHWTNATEQPDHVARAIVEGDSEPFDPVPYFWSDQYDAKLQSLGFVGVGDELAVVRGALDERKWVAIVRSGDRLGGVVGLRSPGQLMKLRPLLAQSATWSAALAATS